MFWMKTRDNHLFRSDVKERQDKMLDPSADSWQALHKRSQKTRSQANTEALERRTAATDRQIDALVYALCGLTEAETQVAEGA